jgi:hypothetical protein
MKSLSQDSKCPSHDMKWQAPHYKSRALSLYQSMELEMMCEVLYSYHNTVCWSSFISFLTASLDLRSTFNLLQVLIMPICECLITSHSVHNIKLPIKTILRCSSFLMQTMISYTINPGSQAIWGTLSQDINLHVFFSLLQYYPSRRLDSEFHKFVV